MSEEERHDSLADQAAAWVPPWDRPAQPRPDPPAPPGPDQTSEDLGSRRPPEGPNPSKISDGVTAAADPGADRHLQGPEPPRTAEAGTPGDDTGIPGDDAGTPGEDVAAEVLAAGGTGGGAGAGGGGGAGVGGAPEGGVSRRGRRRVPEPPPAVVLDDAELRGALEAILLVVDEPVAELTLAQVLEQSPERIGPVLDDIAAGYTAAGHGFELRRAAGGWRLYTRPEYATYVERFVLDGQSVRLTQAALETLAVVAYKQPVTRSRISAIRGVNCDGVIRTLVSRGLIEECGTEPDSGAFLYRTTTMFLEKLGLNSVDELPPLAPFLPDDIEELADATR
ncbi:SMC-Scp complex subunit ScpB [Micromonospora sp. NBC_01412]|uniref:SMC-Scp complex subunit ScpB n=1 Tax=Micromonospora sp. NBC_01412 TaxID=2903590 RepID=UPI0032515984